MRKILLTSLLSLMLAATLPAAAETPEQTADIVTQDKIQAEYDRLAAILNNREDTLKTVRFLHDRISDDAVFRMTVTNRTTSRETSGPALKMNKQDYINTYVQGAALIRDYAMDIKAVSFEYGKDQSEAYTQDIMTERGVMDGGKAFVSRTACRTRHEVRDGKLVETASDCHTDISFEEDA